MTFDSTAFVGLLLATAAGLLLATVEVVVVVALMAAGAILEALALDEAVDAEVVTDLADCWPAAGLAVPVVAAAIPAIPPTDRATMDCIFLCLASDFFCMS